MRIQMKKLVVWGVPLVTLLSAATLLVLTSRSHWTGASVGPEHRFTFPVARQGAIVNHTFELRNSDSDPFKITRVVTSCACALVRGVDSLTLLPGDIVDIPVEFYVGSEGGHAQATVSVLIEGRSEPVLFLLEGDVVEEYPTTVSFGTIRRGEAVKKSFEINTFPGQPEIVILSVSYDRRASHVTFEMSEVRRGAQKVTAALCDTIPYGHFSSTLRVLTNDVEVPEKSIVFSGYVLLPLEVSDKTLYLGVIGARDPVSATVELYSPYGHAVELIGVENAKPGYFAWNVEERGLPDRLKVTISTTEKSPPVGVLKGTLIFHARVGETNEQVRVEAYGLVQ